jgi:hypothetical protein
MPDDRRPRRDPSADDADRRKMGQRETTRRVKGTDRMNRINRIKEIKKKVFPP